MTPVTDRVLCCPHGPGSPRGPVDRVHRTARGVTVLDLLLGVLVLHQLA
ncbi:hypothetical protein JL475_04165 [Streptomyces sp. M2CJ-2]|nr:hypothetical protein [Streptomyces sp. M2CJ-2]MBL3665216.1 hypothetical protein [Streptomyces sp. M2CJ-2]